MEGWERGRDGKIWNGEGNGKKKGEEKWRRKEKRWKLGNKWAVGKTIRNCEATLVRNSKSEGGEGEKRRITMCNVRIMKYLLGELV
jgi:SET domain-containing protein